MGYPIEGVVVEGEGGAEAEKPIAFYLASGRRRPRASRSSRSAPPATTPTRAAPTRSARRSTASWATPIAGHPGFAFSDALKGKGGTWDWDTMSAWLANPKKFAPGTKMTFAGLSNPQDRANVMAFLNSRDASPLPLPAAPAEAAAAPTDAKAAATKPGTGPERPARRRPRTSRLARSSRRQATPRTGGAGALS